MKIKYHIFFLYLLFVFTGCVMQDWNQSIVENMLPGVYDDTTAIVKWEARAMYMQKKDDFSSEDWQRGPCLGKINDQWVVDVVHTPMIVSDWDMSNQCEQYYTEIDVKNYVLLDFEGNIVRMGERNWDLTNSGSGI